MGIRAKRRGLRQQLLPSVFDSYSKRARARGERRALLLRHSQAGFARNHGPIRMETDMRPVLLILCLTFHPLGYGQEAGQAVTPVRNPIASGPLRRNPANPLYFTDGSGKAIYLAGSQYVVKHAGPRHAASASGAL